MHLVQANPLDTLHPPPRSFLPLLCQFLQVLGPESPFVVKGDAHEPNNHMTVRTAILLRTTALNWRFVAIEFWSRALHNFAASPSFSFLFLCPRGATGSPAARLARAITCCTVRTGS